MFPLRLIAPLRYLHRVRDSDGELLPLAALRRRLRNCGSPPPADVTRLALRHQPPGRTVTAESVCGSCLRTVSAAGRRPPAEKQRAPPAAGLGEPPRRAIGGDRR